MNTKLTYFIFAITLLILTNSKLKAKAEPPLVHAIIFCDFTTSLDSSRKNIVTMQNKLIAISDSLKGKGCLEIYAINGDASSEPLLSETFIPTKDNVTERRNFIAALTAAVNKGFSNNKTYTSCIITSIIRAGNIITTSAGDKKINYEVIIISDMLQHCNSKCHCINMHEMDNKQVCTSIDKCTYIENTWKHGNAKNVRLRIIYIGNEKKQQKTKLKDAEIKQDWIRVFNKMGFKGKEETDYYFQNSIPKNLGKF